MSLSLIVITGHRVHLRLVWICHCTQTRLFSGSEWYPFRWALLQIRWLSTVFTLAQQPLLWNALEAVGTSFEFELLWKSGTYSTTQRGPDSIMFSKQAANMSPAENHFKLTPIFGWLLESSIFALMMKKGLCSHCYVLPLIFRWTHNNPNSRKDLGTTLQPSWTA